MVPSWIYGVIPLIDSGKETWVKDLFDLEGARICALVKDDDISRDGASDKGFAN